MLSNKVKNQFEDLLSLIVLRIFAKHKKGMISQENFDMLAAFGAGQAIGIITVSHKRKDLEEMMDEEIRKACELTSDPACGLCKKRGIRVKQGARYIVCKCVNMVFYRGDSVVELGEQYSNKYFTGNTSKLALGSNDLVTNISAAIYLFMIPKQ